MCSVTGCDSFLRGAQRFRLPEEPERRLQWVQFVLEVNEQQLKEASWADISLCSEHFAGDCFTDPEQAQLRPGAVPTLFIKCEEAALSPEHEAEEAPDASSLDDVKPFVRVISWSPKTEEPSPSAVIPKPDVILTPVVLLRPVVIPPPKNTSSTGGTTSTCSGASESPLHGCSIPAIPKPGVTREKVVTTEVPKKNNDQSQPLGRRRTIAQKAALKRKQDAERNRTRVCIGSAFERWRRIMRLRPHLKRDELMAEFLLDNFEKGAQVEPAFTAPPPTPADLLPQRSLNGVKPLGSQSSCSQKSKVVTTDVNKKKAWLLETEGNFVVNERCLLQLLDRHCPSCGAKLEVKKLTCEMLLILDQRCRKCTFSSQWKNIPDADVPTAGSGGGGAAGATAGGQRVTAATPVGAVLSEIVVFSDDESDTSEAEEGESDSPEEKEGTVKKRKKKDNNWNPTEESDFESDDGEEQQEGSVDGEEQQEGSVDNSKPTKRELCTDCGSFFRTQKSHTCEYKVKPFSCNICGKKCTNEIALKIHSRIHDDTYEHPCKYCNVVFKTRLNKLKHEETHQNTTNPYLCSECPQSFAKWIQRKRHMYTHRAKGEYKCKVCDYVFLTVSGLQRHMLVHTALKPYTCSVCDRTFKQSSHLKSHMRLHTGEKPYECRLCDRSFNHNVSLKAHVRRHHASNCGGPGGAEDGRNGEKEGNGMDPDSEGEQRPEEAKEEPKKTFKSTGRPVGRPKREGPKKQRSKPVKSQKRRSKRSSSSDEYSEDDQSHSDVSSQSEDEKEEFVKQKRKKRSQQDSDSDFNPEEETRKRKRTKRSAAVRKTSRKSDGN